MRGSHVSRLVVVVVTACEARNTSDSGPQVVVVTNDPLGPENGALVTDYREVELVPDTLEDDIEIALSGAADLFAMPSGARADVTRTATEIFGACLSTTWAGDVATHTFAGAGCGRISAGTIRSTYTTTPGPLTITHELSNVLTGAGTLTTGKLTIVYTQDPDKVTRTRSAEWSGTTNLRNLAMTYRASLTEVTDVIGKVTTRKGTSTTSVAGREQTSRIDFYTRPGSLSRCPTQTVVVAAQRDGQSLEVTIQQDGRPTYTATTADGRSVSLDSPCTQ